jgi:hypothetical protein
LQGFPLLNKPVNKDAAQDVSQDAEQGSLKGALQAELIQFNGRNTRNFSKNNILRVSVF